MEDRGLSIIVLIIWVIWIGIAALSSYVVGHLRGYRKATRDAVKKVEEIFPYLKDGAQ